MLLLCWTCQVVLKNPQPALGVSPILPTERDTRTQNERGLVSCRQADIRYELTILVGLAACRGRACQYAVAVQCNSSYRSFWQVTAKSLPWNRLVLRKRLFRSWRRRVWLRGQTELFSMLFPAWSAEASSNNVSSLHSQKIKTHSVSK